MPNENDESSPVVRMTKDVPAFDGRAESNPDKMQKYSAASYDTAPLRGVVEPAAEAPAPAQEAAPPAATAPAPVASTEEAAPNSKS